MSTLCKAHIANRRIPSSNVINTFVQRKNFKLGLTNIAWTPLCSCDMENVIIFIKLLHRNGAKLTLRILITYVV